jgi:hypothetical protein
MGCRMGMVVTVAYLIYTGMVFAGIFIAGDARPALGVSFQDGKIPLRHKKIRALGARAANLIVEFKNQYHAGYWYHRNVYGLEVTALSPIS